MLPFIVTIVGAILTTMVATSQAGYTIQDDYNPSNFFKMFDFYNGADPTHGFVKYVDEKIAHANGLITSRGNSVYIGVDHKTISTSGRASVRLSSRKSYTHGLFIADIAHMPGGICGTWPAFWTVGPNWPNNGEIDIIEQVNEARTNQMTLHSSSGCSSHASSLQTGTQLSTDCFAYAAANQGCAVREPDDRSFGRKFNARKGGVYAMEWTRESVAIWFWSRDRIPPNALSASPNPRTWSRPSAKFHGNCNIGQKFKQHQLVFDTTFCGDWAGNTWAKSSCAKKAPSCTDFVAHHPQEFSEAYWEINSLKVFKNS